jgi:hypothetical protein
MQDRSSLCPAYRTRQVRTPRRCHQWPCRRSPRRRWPCRPWPSRCRPMQPDQSRRSVCLRRRERLQQGSSRPWLLRSRHGLEWPQRLRSRSRQVRRGPSCRRKRLPLRRAPRSTPPAVRSLAESASPCPRDKHHVLGQATGLPRSKGGNQDSSSQATDAVPRCRIGGSAKPS